MRKVKRETVREMLLNQCSSTSELKAGVFKVTKLSSLRVQ